MSDKHPSSKISVSWGGHGTGTFGGHGPHTLEHHVVRHPSQEQGGGAELGAEPVDEERLAAAALERLDNEPAVDVDELLIYRDGRELSLYGIVPDRRARELVLSVVRGTPGVTVVHDYLEEELEAA